MCSATKDLEQANNTGGKTRPEYTLEQDELDAALVTTLKEQVSKWTSRWLKSPSDYIGNSGRIIEVSESNDNWHNIENAGEELESSLADAMSKFEGPEREHHHLQLQYQRELVSRALGMVAIFVCNTDSSEGDHLHYILHRGFSQER